MINRTASLSVPPAPHVIITGASGGLGAALAARFATRSARLSLLGRNRERLAAVEAHVASPGCEIESFGCDVRDAEQMRSVLNGIDDAFPATLLIANAGIGGAAALAGSMGESSEIARDLVATNLLGAINTITPLLPRLIARHHGHIVIISSIAGFTGLPHAPSYCASKAAVRIYGTALRRSLRSSGVNVTVVSPGFIETPMSASLPIHQPFLETAEQAAIRIVRAVDKRKPELSFPWQLVMAARIDQWLPASIGDRVMSVIMPRGAAK